jgi:hypothetical protein
MFISTSQKMMLNGDSSPFQSSPFNASDGNSSPRLFWQGRDPSTPNRFNSENLFGGSARESSPSPTRRSSIERLQRASRVKNSNMFAREQKQEYDPTSVPVVERPLAKQLQGNAYGGSGLEGLRSAERRPFGHYRNDSKSSIPLHSPTLTKTSLKTGANGLRSPSKDQVSPTKSSMATRSFNPMSSYDPENGTWSEEETGDEKQLPPGRTLHRHAKSVTFDAAPPQVNEYEMATPDLSSIGTGSRENSYDSGEDEEEESYIRGDSAEQEDSFDASLEDTDKTPVVGPEDWRHASPGPHNSGIMGGRFEDPFEGPEGSPMPDARPSSSNDRPAAIRTDSLNSNGDHRPLPPLPGMRQQRSNSSGSAGLSAAAERASSQRNLPSPPAPSSISKSDIQGMDGGKMSLEERLRLMMIQDEEKPKTQAELQRERRMRRAGARSSQTPEKEQPINIHEDEIHEDEDTLDDLAGLGSYKLPPRISRESILRKVNGQEAYTRDSDYNFSSPMPSSSPERVVLPDPDTPIPSTEDESTLEAVTDSVIIKEEPVNDVDVYSITEMYQTESRMEDYEEHDTSVIRHDVPAEEDAESQYSDPTPYNLSPQVLSNSGPEDNSPPTPRAKSPADKDLSADPVKEDRTSSLPEFASFLDRNDFGLSLQSYMTPTLPLPKDGEEVKVSRMSMTDAHEYLRRPSTPTEREVFAPRPEYDGSGWGPEEEDAFEVGTPDSVIRHPVSPPSPARDSPSIPEHVATIKSSGSKLKTRPSATPSDLMAMRELRRNVSGEISSIPPIPERHRNRPSLSRELSEGPQSDSELERNESFKKKSLKLDIGNDLGLGLDKDFDRVIEAQKVAFDPSHSQSTHSLHDNGPASTSENPPQYDFCANLTPRKQRGYLMRQNTKVVIASSDLDKGTRSAGNSPVKKERPQSWTVEPWNGQMRKNSVRGRPNPRKNAGPVPPMPGQESNVTGLGIVAEDTGTNDPIPEEGGERGRLFVKVIGVKDLDLPLPKSKISATPRFTYSNDQFR